jgi:hypothetical protein
MKFSQYIKKIIKWFVPYGIIEYRRSILQKEWDDLNKKPRR